MVRAGHAAELFRAGRVDRVILTTDTSRQRWSTQLQRNPTAIELAKTALEDSGVPSSRIVVLAGQFRGTAENALLASQRGVNVNLVLSLAWIIAVAAATLSGVLYGGRAFLGSASVTIGLAGLTAALVGGLDSLRGAVVGAFVN